MAPPDARVVEKRLWTFTVPLSIKKRVRRLINRMESDPNINYSEGEMPLAEIIRLLIGRGLNYYEQEYDLD